ncbi:MAG: glycosyltransferase family 2 protein [Candidatus Gastranaerophilales bacterium]|nr:glycosyltransferase family 2 protein [Candidatus Gastranaerophilales bacterium]
MHDVSVVLVSYNTAELTRNCLKSLYVQTVGVDFEVFVVDNNSHDGSSEMIKKEFPQVNLICNRENKGFGAANNLAIEAADSKYVFLLNTDTVLIDNPIKIFFDYMEKTPKAGACGGNLYNADGENVHSYGYLPTKKTKFLRTFQLLPFFKNEQIKVKDKGNNEKNEFKKVDLIIGADLFLRKSVLDSVGSFDEDFFLYFEESELQHRINQAGYEIFILPEAKISHLEGKSTKNRVKTRSYKLISEFLYYKKCYGVSKYSPFKLVIMASHLPRLLVHPVMISKAWSFILSN